MSKKQLETALEINDVVKKIRGSSDLMAKLKSDPKSTLSGFGLNVGDRQVEVHLSDEKTEYFVIPANTSHELDDESLSNLNAAKSCTGTAGSAGSVGTASTFITTIGSASSVGSVGTAGSADTGRKKD
jgi:hypothetical protein